MKTCRCSYEPGSLSQDIQSSPEQHLITSRTSMRMRFGLVVNWIRRRLLTFDTSLPCDWSSMWSFLVSREVKSGVAEKITVVASYFTTVYGHEFVAVGLMQLQLIFDNTTFVFHHPN